jgi:microcystin-dependent protein
MAEGDLIGEVVGGSSQNKAMVDFMRGAEFQAILQGYSYLFTQSTAQTATSAPVGSVISYAAATAPSGWLLCDGTAYPQDLYPSLFAVIERTYGGNSTARTFQVPSLVGRVPIGPGGGRSVAQTGGTETHTLSTGEIPSHNHTLSDPGHAHDAIVEDGSGNNYPVGGLRYQSPGSQGALGYITARTTGISISPAGGGGAHNNMQPYIVLSYIIKAG